MASSRNIIYIHPSEIDYGNITVDKILHLKGFIHSYPDKVTYIAEITFSGNPSNRSLCTIKRF